jgi:hypothetical protein
MTVNASSKPSFSPARKWRIGFHVTLSVVVVFAVVVMVNYLSSHYSKRFYLSTQTRIELSPLTLGLLNSITNQVQVTLYYDHDERFYNTIADLLKEYHSANPKIICRPVDYDRDPGKAEQLKIKYHLGPATNLVIFDCEGKSPQIVDGNVLTKAVLESISSDETNRFLFRRKPVAFQGEMMFTSALLAAVNPKPLKAYYLLGDGEHLVDQTDMGYQTFVSILQTNYYIQVEPLLLLGTNTVPMDCNLLIIAGPTTPMLQSELDSIERYLKEGGRLLALFNVRSAGRETGLEKILAQWGVNVSSSIVTDPVLTSPGGNGSDVIVFSFSEHSAVNPLTGKNLDMILPRMISKLDRPSQAADGLKAEEIASSSPYSFLANQTSSQQRRPLPLMVAVEKGAVKGVITERGLTRMLVVGDSLFLGNAAIKVSANRDFVGLAANWLLDRAFLLQGLGPQPVTEYRLTMSKRQLQTVQWLLLGAMPGGILLFGGLVWLRRRR